MSHIGFQRSPIPSDAAAKDRSRRAAGRSNSPTDLLAGFTIVEVMLAASVMVLAITSSLLIFQSAHRALDTARCTTIAGQVLQSQMEKLRLLSWKQLTTPASQTYFTQDVTESANITAQLKRFTTTTGGVGTFTQSITDAESPFGSTIKIITLTAQWKGIDGKSHSLSYINRYAKNGVSDFYYTSH